MNSLFGLDPLVNLEDVIKLLLRFGINIGCIFIVVQLVYHRLYKNREYVFTYYLLNVITFTLCFLLRKVPAEMGFALAIFAVFGILRYRTEQIRIRDLTYLFVVIGMGVINAVANKSVGLPELLAVNAIVVSAIVLLEFVPFGSRESSTMMFYDRLDLLKPGQQAALALDIFERTGLTTARVEIVNMDLIRDGANLKVFHKA